MSFYEALRVALPLELPRYLASQRWFGGKARQMRSAELLDVIPLQLARCEAFVLLARVEYASGSGGNLRTTGRLDRGAGRARSGFFERFEQRARCGSGSDRRAQERRVPAGASRRHGKEGCPRRRERCNPRGPHEPV